MIFCHIYTDFYFFHFLGITIYIISQILFAIRFQLFLLIWFALICNSFNLLSMLFALKNCLLQLLHYEVLLKVYYCFKLFLLHLHICLCVSSNVSLWFPSLTWMCSLEFYDFSWFPVGFTLCWHAPVCWVVH